jgi:hypothetical protein
MTLDKGWSRVWLYSQCALFVSSCEFVPHHDLQYLQYSYESTNVTHQLPKRKGNSHSFYIITLELALAWACTYRFPCGARWAGESPVHSKVVCYSSIHAQEASSPSPFHAASGGPMWSVFAHTFLYILILGPANPSPREATTAHATTCDQIPCF